WIMRHLSNVRAALARMAFAPLCCAVALLGARVDCAAADEEGFKPIFNGKNLDGWDGNPKFWSADDGMIVGRTTADNPTKGNTFLIWRQAPLDDFVLRLSYKIVGGNSGVQYRSHEVDKWVMAGYQADIDSGDAFSGILYEERERGILAQRGQKVTIDADGKKNVEQVADAKQLQESIHKEDWNDYEIIASGNHLIHKINGQVTAEVIDNQKAKAAASGILALQLHAGPPMNVQFKDIRLKRTHLADGRKKIVMVAGTPSHGPGAHEFNAGTMILKHCLDKAPGVLATAYYNGWPADPTAFDNADSILLYMDGGAGHPVIQRNRLTEIDQLMKRGVGLCCAHYAVEVPKERGGPDLTKWIGGYYETGFSINPHWDARFTNIPKHPVTRGVEPFSINDEWYYNIRFPEGQSGIEPLLSAAPPDTTRHTEAAKSHLGRSEIVAWAVERADGGRGFGFTGGHNHANWGNDNFRKLVLNALLWTAKAEVPPEGVQSTVTPDELTKNLDPKGK
ncbi:MAG TPA: family 16 glycoside hydrolase, partial [Pirellulales bacterium]|nr:family 16 glycoside hydrolase [Pirellulales bacterium]